MVHKRCPYGLFLDKKVWSGGIHLKDSRAYKCMLVKIRKYSCFFIACAKFYFDPLKYIVGRYLWHISFYLRISQFEEFWKYVKSHVRNWPITVLSRSFVSRGLGRESLI